MTALARAWHQWRANVWFDRLLAAQRTVAWSPRSTVPTEMRDVVLSALMAARVEECRQHLRHHLDALGEVP